MAPTSIKLEVVKLLKIEFCGNFILAENALSKGWNKNKRSGSDHDLAHILDDRDLIWLIFLKTIGDRIWLIFQVIGPIVFRSFFRSFSERFLSLCIIFF